MILKILHIRVSGKKPQQLVNDRFQMQFLGCQQREAFAEVETHLIAEHRFCACACAVVLCGAVIKDMLQQIKILFHFGVEV